MGGKDEYIIGVDTGGTFTDSVVMDSKGNIVIGKAETTYDDLANGVWNSISDAAQDMGVTVNELLANTMVFNQGTTIGTNILINFNGVKTGLITTKGFEDVLAIQRAGGRVAGLDAFEIRHQAVARKPTPIIPKTLIRGVRERIDCFGKVVFPLDEEEVRSAVKELVEEGVEAIAVSLLWSFANPEHELFVKKIAEEIAPDIYVQVSSDVAPVIREYGRTNTVVIDTYVGPPMIKWYKALEDRLQQGGYRHSLLTMQAWGGVMPADRMRPIGTINSGPAGGTIASKYYADLLGLENVLSTDVGGTSFDVSVLAEARPVFGRETLIMRYRVETPIVEIRSIGAGGGTMAWVDPNTKLLNVGPQSAGSDPGPVCYMKGGTNPTVTDADMILGYINPDYFLGGKMKLDKQAASSALKKMGKELGMDEVELSAGIFDIQNSHMVDLLRGLLVRRGYHPGEFALFAFGGGGGIHAASYGSMIGVGSIYMFPESSVFSAFGISTADIQQIYNKFDHYFMPADPDKLSKSFEELEHKALADMLRMGFKEKEVTLRRELEMKFGRQVHVEIMPIESKRYSEEDIKKLETDFVEHYTNVYGEGGAFVEGGTQILNLRVTATVAVPTPSIKKRTKGSSDAKPAIKGEREVYWTSFQGFRPTNIYDFDRLDAGMMFDGPAVVEAATTTLVILPEQTAKVDEYLNVIIAKP